MKNILWILLLSVVILSSCGDNKKQKTGQQKSKPKSTIVIPEFNSDSAYLYVEKQMDFGPRVPNTKEHSLCAKFLTDKLKSFADTAFVQSFKIRAFDGTVLNAKNIIGSFNINRGNRILLCSHWDSRPFADHDPDPANHDKPVPAANDGASGVGVLLEVARQMSIKKPAIGIDIIFFDVEDYGPPQDSPMRGQGDFWGLGSQYWSRNPHKPDYNAKFGILLDMVGAGDARFYMEGVSMNFAANILNKVWKTAHRIGYSDYFIFEQTGYIEDDHKYINEIINIPTIDIIHLDAGSSNGSFFEYWHTVSDKMDVIDKETLKVVGQTLLTVIYEEK